MMNSNRSPEITVGLVNPRGDRLPIPGGLAVFIHLKRSEGFVFARLNLYMVREWRNDFEVDKSEIKAAYSLFVQWRIRVPVVMWQRSRVCSFEFCNLFPIVGTWPGSLNYSNPHRLSKAREGGNFN